MGQLASVPGNRVLIFCQCTQSTVTCNKVTFIHGDAIGARSCLRQSGSRNTFLDHKRRFESTLYTLCIMPRESHQNKVSRSRRSVAFYLRSSRNIALTKIHFKYFLGLYSLEKEHNISKINLGLSHRPCFDKTRFQVPSANEALCIACIDSFI